MNLSKPPRCPVYTRAMREDREMVVATFLARLWSRAEFRCETLAAALAVIAVFVLSAIALVDPGLADRATAESGVVEWFQVLLDAAAAVLFGRHLVRKLDRDRRALGTGARGERGAGRLHRALRAQARPRPGRAALLSRGGVRAGGRDRVSRIRGRPPLRRLEPHSTT